MLQQVSLNRISNGNYSRNGFSKKGVSNSVSNIQNSPCYQKYNASKLAEAYRGYNNIHLASTVSFGSNFADAFDEVVRSMVTCEDKAHGKAGEVVGSRIDVSSLVSKFIDDLPRYDDAIKTTVVVHNDKNKDLITQFREVKDIMTKKWNDAYYIAYFQANTNTYKPLNELKKLFDEAINLNPDIKVISLATRPDCLETDVLDYLQELNQRKKVWIELGLQTSNETTSAFINRGYKLPIFTQAVKELRKRGKSFNSRNKRPSKYSLSSRYPFSD